MMACDLELSITTVGHFGYASLTTERGWRLIMGLHVGQHAAWQ